MLGVKVTGTATAIQLDSFDREWQQELETHGACLSGAGLAGLAG